jgi:hypothetical protein
VEPAVIEFFPLSGLQNIQNQLTGGWQRNKEPDRKSHSAFFMKTKANYKSAIRKYAEDNLATKKQADAHQKVYDEIC